MRSKKHELHLQQNVGRNDCQECRADTERRFLRRQFAYQFVADYLAYVRPRLEAIKNGESGSDSHHWMKEFQRALHRRIGLKLGDEQGRKRCDSYLERLKQFPRSTDANYLRRFAQRGASTLN